LFLKKTTKGRAKKKSRRALKKKKMSACGTTCLNWGLRPQTPARGLRPSTRMAGQAGQTPPPDAHTEQAPPSCGLKSAIIL